jgi:hypothetical protein
LVGVLGRSLGWRLGDRLHRCSQAIFDRQAARPGWRIPQGRLLADQVLDEQRVYGRDNPGDRVRPIISRQYGMQVNREEKNLGPLKREVPQDTGRKQAQ